MISQSQARRIWQLVPALWEKASACLYLFALLQINTSHYTSRPTSVKGWSFMQIKITTPSITHDNIYANYTGRICLQSKCSLVVKSSGGKFICAPPAPPPPPHFFLFFFKFLFSSSPDLQVLSVQQFCHI